MSAVPTEKGILVLVSSFGFFQVQFGLWTTGFPSTYHLRNVIHQLAYADQVNQLYVCAHFVHLLH